ncbi:MAG: hypothetical protein ACRDWT_14165 [Jatrophihabitantaceae bacterium]
MSDTAGKRPGKSVSLDKRGESTGQKANGKPAAAPRKALGRPNGAADRTPTPSVPIPWTIQWATIAIGAQIVFTLVRGLSIRGYTSELTTWLINSNHKAKKPIPDAKYATQIPHDLSSLRNGMLIQGVVVCIAMAILGFSIRRARGASGARWALLVIIVLTSGPLAIAPVAGFPTVPKIAGVLMGVASIAVIILILLPASLRYFRACKAATRPEGAPVRPGLASMLTGRGAAGGGAAGRPAAVRPAAGRGLLGSLLAPRPPRASTPAAGSTVPAKPDSANPPRPKSKAKVRVEAEAVAKGAELARTRAKASKSRRTETT